MSYDPDARQRLAGGLFFTALMALVFVFILMVPQTCNEGKKNLYPPIPEGR